MPGKTGLVTEQSKESELFYWYNGESLKSFLPRSYRTCHWLLCGDQLVAHEEKGREAWEQEAFVCPGQAGGEGGDGRMGTDVFGGMFGGL